MDENTPKKGGRSSAAIAFAAAAGLFPSGRPEGDTHFSRLSEEAQELIVNAVLGMYEDGPPEMSDEIHKELEAWAASGECDEPQTRLS